MVGEIKLRPVEGRPPAQSAPSDRKASWKESVRKAVPSDAAFLGDRPLRVRIDFYLKGNRPRNKLPDVDNMIPPILNALEGSRDDRGSLYADDNTVEEICARRIDRDEHEPDRDGASDKLQGALDRWDEFVLIRVTPVR